MTDDNAMPSVGLLDTCTVIGFSEIDRGGLPTISTVCTITMAELQAGPHAARGDAEEEVRRRRRLTWAQAAFPDPLPFDHHAAEIYGSVSLLHLAAGRKPRTFLADLMIASIAIANGLPLYTRNPEDFEPLRSLLDVREV
ncbi:type II toxin-antitoxin system VapC family toxin [Glycomyces sp. TRM65418]|uniref:type II toxin-antitoxin system VapC family toxin n=1 Tax=Glycomyces sp. TRM65418 TaxID=2867006 RepID=UPI001CE5B393|nr:type II toxin-antitoxin system VapC family toxin [Glycomyces sp. TRM65418]MCC3763795.1 type II toxin-antitoxin system VapC family toxin [Glycomyces sp. TRM65418]QZD53503.1 type II toxin-antitoxin system VapC family toxin [Glycomyces sp. TRM65418]